MRTSAARRAVFLATQTLAIIVNNNSIHLQSSATAFIVSTNTTTIDTIIK
jgi:hypothetical protein